MSAKHKHGPWRYWVCRVDSSIEPAMYDYVQFANPSGHVFRAPLRYMSEEDARRIVACVNACEGVSNEVLEDVNSSEREMLRHFVAVQGQRKDLLEALKALFAKQLAISKVTGFNP